MDESTVDKERYARWDKFCEYCGWKFQEIPEANLNGGYGWEEWKKQKKNI